MSVVGRWLGAVSVAMLVLASAAGAAAPTITEYGAGITAGSGSFGIAAGPDGNLWFTEYAGSRIGRITTAGAVTEYSAGITAGSSPYGIAAGPDDNLWFTEFIGDRIGKITTAGAVTEYSLGITAGSRPHGIAKGGDGNLWFTEQVGNRIGRITTAGAVSEYSAGITAGSSPYGIALGPDGNLWFTEGAGNRIGKITTAGAVTEYSAGITANSVLSGVALSPDGNLYLWFTEQVGRIGRITTDVTAPLLSLPGARAVEATGPAGAIVTWSASASDPDDTAGPVSCVPSSGSRFRLGLTSVVCSSTDTHGNTGSGQFTVTVQDSTPPALSGTPAQITLEATGPNGATASYQRPSANDLVDGSRPVNCSPAPGSSFPLGTRTVTCTSSDTRGNKATRTFLVTVKDTTAPDLRLPKRLIHATTSSKNGRRLRLHPVALDRVDGPVAETCRPASPHLFKLGKTTVRCRATDRAGNTATGSFNVLVTRKRGY
ncbi:MAG TPA: HYR domain-containing protein [Gaiellaceae bacterium]